MDATGLNKLEREVERGLAALASELEVGEPRSAAVQRVRAAVAEEARRMHALERQRGAWRPLVGMAAAVALVLVLHVPMTSGPQAPLAGAWDPNDALQTWAEAADESSRRVTQSLNGSLEASDNERESGDDPFQSVEESFELFERMIGA